MRAAQRVLIAEVRVGVRREERRRLPFFGKRLGPSCAIRHRTPRRFRPSRLQPGTMQLRPVAAARDAISPKPKWKSSLEIGRGGSSEVRLPGA